MKYLELIPIILFVLMVIMDHIHLGKLNQLVKDFEEINSGEKIPHPYLHSETMLIHEYRKEEPAGDEKILITSESGYHRDPTGPSVIFEVSSQEFLW